jgi:endonuclease/exonuclease/phosphatase family metal-dependent hydrolase
VTAAANGLAQASADRARDAAPTPLHLVTYNIHKGFPAFSRRLSLPDLRDRLRASGADVVLLQEVQGLSHRLAQRVHDWPTQPQIEYLADQVWSDHAYARNAVYDHGHHGNAVLSRFPILGWRHADLSQSRFEGRGLLHARIDVPGWSQPLHVINLHLALLAVWRHRQLAHVAEWIAQHVPADAPLVVAGDFNDWTRQAGRRFGRATGLTEVFEHTVGRPARSFPAALPLLTLDRIYVRHLRVALAHAHSGRHARRLSDHVALSALLVEDRATSNTAASASHGDRPDGAAVPTAVADARSATAPVATPVAVVIAASTGAREAPP